MWHRDLQQILRNYLGRQLFACRPSSLGPGAVLLPPTTEIDNVAKTDPLPLDWRFEVLKVISGEDSERTCNNNEEIFKMKTSGILAVGSEKLSSTS